MAEDPKKERVAVAKPGTALKVIRALQSHAATLAKEKRVTEADLAAYLSKNYSVEAQRAVARRFLIDVLKRPTVDIPPDVAGAGADDLGVPKAGPASPPTPDE